MGGGGWSHRITRKSEPGKALVVVPAACATGGESVGSGGVSGRKQGMEKPHRAALIKQDKRSGTAASLTCTSQACARREKM